MQQLSFEINGVTTPMDVLLTLIAKHKLNIYDIAISQLLEQYLNYLADCQEQDLELAGAFLEMAARLIYLNGCPAAKAAGGTGGQRGLAGILAALCTL